MKKCSKCGLLKDLSSFHRSSIHKSGMNGICKSCVACRAKKYYQEHRQSIHASHTKWAKNDPQKAKDSWHKTWIKRTYGLSVEDYQGMMAAQDGRCAICRKEPNGTKLSVDHNHDTGKIRGLLCKVCNGFLGWIKENQEFAGNVKSYLEKYENSCLL